MLKKQVLCLLTAAMLLCGAVPALAAGAGSPDDPLVSLSYAKTWSQTVLNSSAPSISSTLNPFYEKAAKNALAALSKGVGASSCALSAGGTIKLTTGSSIIMLSGSASMSITSGAVVNVTQGSAAASGNLSRYHRYIACENSSVTVSAGAVSTFLIDGAYEKSGGTEVFTDVKATDWFYQDVYMAVEMGLINGMTLSTYEPAGKLTVAQAVKLAACMHQLYNDGEVTLQNGSPWYKPYADYALENGIIAQGVSDYESAITRERFVDIFYKALPESEYTEINNIADGSIPGISMDHAYSAEIYGFYRAGILTGYTNTPGKQENAFGPKDAILRSEVASILIRMFSSDARKQFTIG